MVEMLDPNYVNECWTTPVYLGHDPASGLADLRFTFDTTVSAVTPGFPPLFELSDVPARDFSNAHLIIIDGDYAGRSVPIARVAGRCIRFAYARPDERRVGKECVRPCRSRGAP